MGGPGITVSILESLLTSQVAPFMPSTPCKYFYLQTHSIHTQSTVEGIHILFLLRDKDSEAWRSDLYKVM